MDNSSSSSNSGKVAETKPGSADETKTIADFAAMTGATESQARNIYIYSEIISHRDPYSYHLE